MSSVCAMVLDEDRALASEGEGDELTHLARAPVGRWRVDEQLAG
ncbi:hypothetical protein WMF28_25940 [Sorangium sp. So ce590]